MVIPPRLLAGGLALAAAAALGAWTGYDYRDARAGRQLAAALAQAHHDEGVLRDAAEETAGRARDEIVRLRVDVAAGDEQLGRLRRGYRAQLQAAVAAAATGGVGAGDAIGVLADVYDRAEARTGEIAAYADELAIARRACERTYQSARELR